MSKKEDEAFAEWKAEMAERYKDDPEGLKAFQAFTDTSQGREIYRGQLRESEFHKRMSQLDIDRKAVEKGKDDLEKDVQALNEWFEDQQAEREKLEAELEKAKAGATEVVDPDDSLAQPNVDKLTSALDAMRAEVKAAHEKADQLNRGIPTVLAQGLAVQKRATEEGFDVDPNALIEEAMKKGVPLDRAYEDMTREQRAAKAEADIEARIEKAKEDGRRSALAERENPGFLGSEGIASPAVAKLFEDMESDDNDRVKRGTQVMLEEAGGNPIL